MPVDSQCRCIIGNVKDCVELLERVRHDTQPGRMFWTGLEYRYIPAISKLIREVDSGVCGEVRMVTIREHRFPFLRKVGSSHC